MARTIIEDYMKSDKNHFNLAYNIARRARDIQRRGNARVSEDGDKAIVIALREIVEKPMTPESDEDARGE